MRGAIALLRCLADALLMPGAPRLPIEGLYRWRRAMKPIVERLKSDSAALEQALAEIERVRRALADELARIAELRRRIAELEDRS